jgi:hypothetical protein
MKRLAKARVAAGAIGLLLCGVLAGPAPALAATGSISGTVTAAETGEGAPGVWVCASTNVFGLHGGCQSTDADGHYLIEGLEPAFYEVAFEEEGRQNYLAQWYPDKPAEEEAVWVEVKSGEGVTGVNAAMDAGGLIAGTVTDVGTGLPVEGIEICARQVDRVFEQGVIHCDASDAAGDYEVWALPSGQYKVEFGPQVFNRDAPNYIRQYYPARPSWSEAEVLGVSAGASLSGIDAALQQGIGVSGTVSEVGGGPVTSGSTRVCALAAASKEEIVQCTGVEMDGTYWIPGLPFGNYRISFAVDVEEDGQILHPDGFVRQYYNGKPTFAEADVLGSAGTAVFSGIDAHLVRGPEVFPPKPVAPQPLIVTLVERPAPKPLRCRKHFHKKWVKGRYRCVRKHRKSHRHSHKRGPHAVTTGR